MTGIIPEDRNIGALQRELELVLLRLAEGGERVAVLVDEAHRLNRKVLEGLRLLSNLDTEKEKLMCLLLIGQPELERTLRARVLRPLAQRISVRYRLGSLCWRETLQYISHRLHVAGRFSHFQFGTAEKLLIHSMSQGVPGRINQLCDRTLVAAYSRHRYVVSPWIVWQANREVSGLVH